MTLVPGGSGYRAQVQVAEPLAAGVIGPAGLQDPQALQAALTRLREQAGLGACRVVITCPENVVLFRRIPMPPMQPERVKQALKLGAGQYIPVPGGDFAADFLVRSDPERPDEVSVLVAAAPRNTLAGICRAARAAGLNPTGISTPALAISWLLGNWQLAAPELNTAVLVVSGQDLRTYTFSGTTPLAARTLTASVADSGEAFLEIRRSLAVGGRLPARLLIIGDVPDQWRADLTAVLNRNFADSGREAMEVLVAPPVAEGLAGAFTVAAGEAALDQRARDRINLLQARLFPYETRSWSWQAVTMSVLLAALALYVTWWVPQLQATRSAMARANAAAQAGVAADIGSVAPELPVLAELQRTPAWSRLVGELLSRAPGGVSVRELKEPDSGLAGAAGDQGPRPSPTVRLLLSGTTRGLDQITAYVKALRGSEQIARVAVAAAARNGAGDLNFDLTLDVLTGGVR